MLGEVDLPSSEAILRWKKLLIVPVAGLTMALFWLELLSFSLPG